MSSAMNAPKHISASPAKGSVTAPIDPQQKERDVQRKIKIYGAIDALRHGKLPTNEQIDAFLSSLLSRSPTTANTVTPSPHAAPTPPSAIGNLSPAGKQLTQDLKAIVETLRVLVTSKNGDERVQALIARLRDVRADDLKAHIDNATAEAAPDTEKVVQDRDRAIKHLRTILSLLLTNLEARKLFTDFSLIGRDLLAHGAIQAAEMLRPDEERLAGVDDSAPADRFIDPEERSGTGSNVQQNLPDGLSQTHQEAATKFRQGDLPGVRDTLRDDVYNTAQDKLRTQGGERVGELKEDVQREQQELQEAEEVGDDEQVEEKKRGLKERMRNLRDNVKGSLSNSVPDKHKDLAQDKVERTKRFLNEEYLPKDRRDQFIYRGKKVIMECQKHDDYQESMTWLIGAVEEYAEHGRNVAGTGKEHVGGITNDPSLSACFDDIRVLLERFANGKSLDIVKQAIDAMIDDANRDEELKDWWRSVDSYVRRVLLEPGYVIEPDCNRQGNILRENGRRFFDEKYKEHFDNLFSSVAEWAKGWQEDPVNKAFGNDWARLAKDLLFDSDGKFQFKRELWDDIRKVLLPTFIEKVGYIPIPRVEYTDDSLDLVVENLTLEGRNLFPNIIGFESHNHFRFSPYGAIVRDIKNSRKQADEETHRVRIELEQIQADMRDVRFLYRRKTGIMKLRDEGVADVILGGSGMNITIDLATSPSSPSLLASPNVKVTIDTLKFTIRDANHEFLYKTVKPLATRLIKRQLEKAIGEAVALAVGVVEEGAGRVLRGITDMAGAAREGAKEGAANAAQGNVPADRAANDAAANAASRAQEKAPAHPARDPPGPATQRAASIASSASKKNAQFKVVTDARESVLPNDGHPEGWVQKIGETKGVARAEGKSWRSDAFTI